MATDDMDELQDAVAGLTGQIAIVNDALETAQKPVNLSRLLLTPEGRMEVMSNWALMTQEYDKPSARIWAALMPEPQQVSMPGATGLALEGDRVVVNATSTDLRRSASDWTKIDGAARDIAIGSDGTVYAIGVTKKGSGYEIFKCAKTADKWTRVDGTATRVAVAGAVPWAVNGKGHIFAQSGSRWQRIAGPAAQDIGASDKAVWIVGVDGKIYVRAGNNWQGVAGTARRIDIDQDGRPWVVNDQGNIYVHDNNRNWQKLPGTATDVAVDVPGMARIVGTDGKSYVFNAMKRNWDAISQDTDYDAIGAGGGHVLRLTKKNEIYQLH
ncbi:MAG: tectonin domain-containing protein [Rhodospirillales bacterium]